MLANGKRNLLVAIILMLVFAHPVHAEQPVRIVYEGSFEGEPQANWELQNRLGNKPGPPIIMDITINERNITGTVSINGQTFPINGYNSSLICMLGVADFAKITGECGRRREWSGSFEQFRDSRSYRFTVFPKIIQSLQKYRPRDWIGYSPMSLRSGANLFGSFNHDFVKIFMRSNPYDRMNRGPDAIIWGSVRQSGDGFLAIPFCLKGQCNDPNVSSPNIAVLHEKYVSSEGKVSSELILIMSTDFGTRFCKVGQIEYEFPACYNSNLPYNSNFRTNNLGSDIFRYFDFIANEFETKNPPDPGKDFMYFLKTRKCELKFFEGLDWTGRVVENESRFVCQ